MQRKNYKGRCEKRSLDKAQNVCRFYNSIQSTFAELLEADQSIVEITCNVLMDGLDMGDYTSDFYCKRADGTYMIRECVQRKYLTKPKTVKELEASRKYWRSHGVDDWGIVIDEGEK